MDSGNIYARAASTGLSNASAAVGPFSTVNYWSRLTSQPNLAINSYFALLGNLRSRSGNQTLWGCCAVSNGCHITASGGASNRLDIYMRGGANPFYPLNGASAAPNGYFCLLLTRTPSGAFRSCINGLAVTQPSAAPAYVDLDITSIETIGRVNPAVNTFAGVSEDVIAIAYGTRALSDTELRKWSASIVSDNLFELHPELRADSSLQYELHFARDWDGSASSIVTALGATPATFTKQGTGGTKNILPAFQRYSFSGIQQLSNCDFLDLTGISIPANKLQQANHFASSKFDTAATQVVIDIAPTNNGSVNDSDRIGIIIAGVEDTTEQHLWGFDAPQTFVRSGLSGSSKRVEVVNNYHEFSPDGIGGTVNYGIGNVITGIRTPVGSAPVFDLSVPQAILAIMGNSMTGKVVGGNGALTGSTKQSYVALARKNVRSSSVPAWANGDVIADGWGGRNWFDVCSNDAKRQVFALRHAQMLRATAKNVIFWCLDINDYILNPWAGSLTNYMAGLGAYLDLFKTIADNLPIINPTYLLCTSQPKTDESPVGGRTAQDFRDSTTTVGNARSWLTVVQGPTMTDVTDLGDNLHFSAGGAGAPNPTKGHVHMESSLRAIVGY